MISLWFWYHLYILFFLDFEGIIRNISIIGTTNFFVSFELWRNKMGENAADFFHVCIMSWLFSTDLPKFTRFINLSHCFIRKQGLNWNFLLKRLERTIIIVLMAFESSVTLQPVAEKVIKAIVWNEQCSI